jgi:hypothetical protein
MAWIDQSRETVGPYAWHCGQLLGGTFGVERLGDSIYPLKMLPLLIFQLFYKSVWVLAVGLPLRSAGPLDPVAAELFNICAKGLVVDLIVIPWPYVLTHYVKKPGDRWRSMRS